MTGPLLRLPGLLLALLLPAMAALRLGFGDVSAAIALAVIPYLTLIWVIRIERRPLSSIGLAVPTWKIWLLGIVGACVNLGVTVAVTAISTHFGLVETQSNLMGRLLQGSGVLLVFLATNGAMLTEISFRAYSTERLGELLGRRYIAAALVQIALTTAIFCASRGWAHGLVWLIDDVVFTAYYLKSRNTAVCIVAHAIPNLLASTLVALGMAD